MAGVESKMESWLNCAVCQDTVKQPKTLTCFHSFCEGCVRQLTKTSHTEKPGVNCPVCRAFTEDSMVKTNFLVHELLETHEGMPLHYTDEVTTVPIPETLIELLINVC